ncbi:protein of unknown function [Candidatus Hydrogenisulfobacillus filiaventi]|uniref:Uncharacterized protein n=1 Tax=Candidatus Hydrogenisulfobacillus filiaventi TaxID=2707344 RepID=A0A6F8ZGX7_9FIRM|nr:hypothetical protein [Bacillota bacterium]CAB1129137.1 protein of unknown function [Candidatus Hydrogenisulfobacillus filiaventi]
MHESFWPHFPYPFPASPGLPHWWDAVWWVIQVVVMTGLLMGLRALAQAVDRDMAAAEQESPPGGGR